MELRHLRYFIAVAEELHFTRAAARLHIGQPPLSHAIQQLEADIGAQLFERSKRWVRLTEAGRLFLADARRILALAESAADTARRAERGEAGELRIGFTFSTPLTPLFATVINRYRAEFPAVSLTLHEMSTLRQLDALGQRTLDLGFIRPIDGAIPDTLALSQKPAIAISDLEHLPFVMYPQSAGTGIYPQIFRLCRAAGFVPRIGQEAGEASTIIGLVAAGCGVSLLPGSFDRIRMDGVCYRPIIDASATTTLLLARRAGESAPLVDAFIALVASAV